MLLCGLIYGYVTSVRAQEDREEHLNEIHISGQSLAIISIAFALFGILFIVNTLMCCYNACALSRYHNKRKHKISHFDDSSDELDDPIQLQY